MSDQEDGLLDSAILLMSLGTEAAADIFRHLSPKEAERLGKAMSEVSVVEPQLITGVLDRLKAEIEAKNYLVDDTNAYVKSVLTKALGDNKASLLIERIIQEDKIEGIDDLRWMSAEEVAELVREEHPQIVASILVHLDRDHAAQVLMRLDDTVRGEILFRITTLGGIQPAAMDELNQVLGNLLGSGARKSSAAALGGTKPAAELLNFMSSITEQEIVSWIQEKDADLAQEITDQMFVFDDLMNLDDKAMQMVLREAQGDALIIALKGADPELREKVFKNMSQRAAETLREDLDSKGPVKVSEVESEQKEIIKTVKRLADEGQISLGTGGGDDDYV
jgi:flagellar motor switch protein FliG